MSPRRRDGASAHRPDPEAAEPRVTTSDRSPEWYRAEVQRLDRIGLPVPAHWRQQAAQADSTSDDQALTSENTRRAHTVSTREDRPTP